MTEEILRAALDAAEAKSDSDGWSELPEGRTMTLYASHDGVALNVSKIEAVQTSASLLRARNVKGELFVLALKDVFAAALDGGGGKLGQSRKAGFLG